MTERTTCNQPDRHQARLVCGHPLPCPYHTAVINPTGNLTTIGFDVGVRYRSPASDYAREVVIEDIRGGWIFVQNVVTGRRSTMKPSTLTRWTRIPE